MKIPTNFFIWVNSFFSTRSTNSCSLRSELRAKFPGQIRANNRFLQLVEKTSRPSCKLQSRHRRKEAVLRATRNANTTPAITAAQYPAAPNGRLAGATCKRSRPSAAPRTARLHLPPPAPCPGDTAQGPPLQRSPAAAHAPPRGPTSSVEWFTRGSGPARFRGVWPYGWCIWCWIRWGPFSFSFLFFFFFFFFSLSRFLMETGEYDALFM